MINYIEQLFDIVGLGNQLDINDISRYYMFEYPNFTEAKQLRLIKLIANERCNVLIGSTIIESDVDAVSDGYHDRDFEEYNAELTHDKSVCFYNSTFEQRLAQLALELIQEGKLDKEKVKEILQYTHTQFK